jgi:hypothetical protein
MATSHGFHTARLVALDDQGRAWVAPQEPTSVGSPAGPLAAQRARSHVPARSTVPLSPAQVGREVLVAWANQPPEPVIGGVIREPGDELSGEERTGNEPALDLVVRRRRIVLEADSEVVLRCGPGSITLSPEGKACIRGVDVVSSAERTQRIRGGSVRIN